MYEKHSFVGRTAALDYQYIVLITYSVLNKLHDLKNSKRNVSFIFRMESTPTIRNSENDSFPSKWYHFGKKICPVSSCALVLIIYELTRACWQQNLFKSFLKILVRVSETTCIMSIIVFIFVWICLTILAHVAKTTCTIPVTYVL